ncbi:hypothetical protein D3C73_1361400 [compost metagenome]
MLQHFQIVAFILVGVAFRQDHFQQQFMAGFAAAAIHIANQFILLTAQFGGVMRMVKHQTFHYVLLRPVDQLRANIAVLQPQRT